MNRFSAFNLNSECRSKPLGIAAALAASLCVAPAQFTINGVTDKTVYADSVTLTVVTQAGYQYAVFLNTNDAPNPVPAGVALTVNKPDFYQLWAFRTNTANPADVTNRLVRFIVRSSERGSTENGIPPWTPLPVIPSSSNEFAGATLRLVTPSNFPAGYEIPVVAWVENAAGHAVRANGTLAAEGHPPIAIKRGVGSGFLAATNSAGPLLYAPRLHGLAASKTVYLETGTVWTAVSGILGGNVTWPAHSRIHVTTNLTIPSGATLTIEAGTVVRINRGTDITNNGALVIHGTVDQPVIFMPNSRAQPWGGFISKTLNAGHVTATGAIFTGSGAIPNWFGTGGNPGSHRTEQALFFCQGGQRLTLTDCAAISLAGQLGHTVSSSTISDLTLTRFLMQRCTTGGEYTGANFTVNDSAFIECPDDSVNFVDGDNDALYLTMGTHHFTNTLVGWTKDDGIDSGGSGAGLFHYQDCWFEATFHEGNSLSGTGKDVAHHHGVFFGCGQALEVGYDAPTGRLDRCLAVAGMVGARFGDNYDWTYNGFLRATNSLLLYNYRDIFGHAWNPTGSGWATNSWVERVGQMAVSNNLVTTLNTNHPLNTLWDPIRDAARLAEYQSVPDAVVGLGFATRATFAPLATLSNAPVPVGLSVFSTRPVSCDFIVTGLGGGSETVITNGTLTLWPGQVLRHFAVAPASLAGYELVRVALTNPVNADLTGLRTLYFTGPAPGGPARSLLVPANAVWRYFDQGQDLGTAWRSTNYADNIWSNGPAPLGFGLTVATPITRGPGSDVYRTFYFRRPFFVEDPAAFSTLTFILRRDDGAVLYLNEGELYRSNMRTNETITYTNFSQTTISGSAESYRYHTNVISRAALPLRPGTNLLAVEVHQASTTSSDLFFELEVWGDPAPSLAITMPTNGQPFRLGDEMLVGVSAASVASVTLWADGQLLGSAIGAPFYFLVTNATVGSRTLTAIGTPLTGGSVTSAPVTITVLDADTDGDGLPDIWERAHGLIVGVNDADADADHDGLTNLHEYLAGTDPQVASSCLKVLAAEMTGAGEAFRLQFEAVSNRTYRVLYADALPTNLWTTLEVLGPFPTSRLVTVTNLNPAVPRRFYRIAIPGP